MLEEGRVVNDGRLEKVVESEVEDDAGYSEREQLQRCTMELHYVYCVLPP